MNEIRTIPLEHIKPFDDQPRKYFDDQALQELSDSIRQQGQYTPAWVVRSGKLAKDGVPQQYQLVAGERRWRACRLAGIKTLVCEVREYETKAEQYVASVMENFGRKDCTTMEAARSVGRLLKVYGSKKEVATVFARSENWVGQMNILNRLEPEIQAMLEPPNAVITMLVGVSLANLTPKLQLRLAREIADKKLRHGAALSLVRTSVTNDDRISKKGKRNPSDDFAILKSFLDALGAKAQAIMALGNERVNAMFINRGANDKELIRKVLQKRIAQLKELDEVLR